MKLSKLPDLSIPALRNAYTSGTFTPAELITAIYDEIESASLNPVWISLIPRQDALRAVEAIKAKVELPLWGIPFAVKDNFDVARMPTTAGCPAYSYVPQKDAFVVALLRQAGAILIGKTNLDQFATGLVGTRTPYGPCSSVFDNRYISGGSSSGSAVAVASGLVSFSLGTDTAGSGRVPAAFNNIVGLKPSKGLISTSGVIPACRSLDCVSVFALSTSDAQAILDVVQAFDPEDPFSRIRPSAAIPSRTPSLRLGVPLTHQLEFFGNDEYRRLYTETLKALLDDGQSLVQIDLSPFRDCAELLYAGPYVAERFVAVGKFVQEHAGSVDPIVASIITGAERYSAADAYEALYKLRALEKQTEISWNEMDALVLPTTPTTYTIADVTADPLRLNSRLGYYTNFANLLDLCAVAAPAGFTSSGLPFGVTFMGRTFSEGLLLGLAQSLQLKKAPSAGHYLSAVPREPLQMPRRDKNVLLGVVGAHLSGQPLNYQLLERKARLLSTTKTAASYKMFALASLVPPKPGLVKVPGFSGPGIEIEIWEMQSEYFGSFVANVPAPLSIGACELEDGTQVKGFLCEPYAIHDMPDITGLGGWRAYLADS